VILRQQPHSFLFAGDSGVIAGSAAWPGLLSRNAGSNVASRQTAFACLIISKVVAQCELHSDAGLPSRG
jgi:hypothetical protein